MPPDIYLSAGLILDDPIEQGLLGPVTLVTTSILVPAGHPGRHMGHDPRPWDTVFIQCFDDWLNPPSIYRSDTLTGWPRLY